MLDVLVLREKGTKWDLRVLNILLLIKSVFWKVRFFEKNSLFTFLNFLFHCIILISVEIHVTMKLFLLNISAHCNVSIIYSRLPITRTFKGNRKKFELSGVRVIGSSKKIAESKVKNSFYCTVNILITFTCRNVEGKLKDTCRL